jgi:uncharacterized membrane protein YkoI
MSVRARQWQSSGPPDDRRRALAAAATALLAGALSFHPAWAGGGDDHERATRAVRSGQILPLQMVLDSLLRDHPGTVLEVELERDDGRWIYEVKLLRSDGQLDKFKLDAKTAAVLRRKR